MSLSVIQIILLAAFALAIVAAWRRGGRGRVLSRLESVGWTALWSAAAAVVAWPELASRAARAVGVGRGADVAVYAAIVALFYLLFRVFLRIDRIERDMTTLVRRDALERREKPADTTAPGARP